MTRDDLRKDKQTKTEKDMRVTVCGLEVRLIFARKRNVEAPAIVGQILKNSYLQHQRRWDKGGLP